MLTRGYSIHKLQVFFLKLINTCTNSGVDFDFEFLDLKELTLIISGSKSYLSMFSIKDPCTGASKLSRCLGNENCENGLYKPYENRNPTKATHK